MLGGKVSVANPAPVQQEPSMPMTEAAESTNPKAEAPQARAQRPEPPRAASESWRERRKNRPAPTGAYMSTVFGLLVVTGLIGGVGYWAGTAPLSSAVVAEAFVAVDSHRKSVQHPDGGVVAQLLVRDGATVRAGQPVIVLDETRPRASYQILRASHDSLLAIEARLTAERDLLADISFPKPLLSRKSDPEVKDLIKGQTTLFQSRRESLEGELAILGQRRAQLQEEIKGLKAQYESKSQQLVLINDELTSLVQLLDKGLASKPRVLALQRESAKILGERGEISAQMARARKSIGEAKLQIIQNETRFREKVVTELRETRTRVVDVAERMSAAKTVLERIVIRAPVAGIVVNMTVHNTGAFVSQGQVVAEIVPSQDQLVVQARVQPIDVDNLTPGQDAEVRILAFKQRDTPTLLGRLDYVSADRLTDQRSGAPYYSARIVVPPEQLSVLQTKKLIPGMPAEVIVKTGDRVAIDYIIEPILASMNRSMREN